MLVSFFRFFFIHMFRSRASLIARITLLEEQLEVVMRKKRKYKRWRITNADRFFWVVVSFIYPGWQSCLKIFKPETVVSWHYRFYGWYWRWICRGGGKGRPAVPLELRKLIRQMCHDNPMIGAVQLHEELEKLGYDISQASVSKYMVRKHRRRGRGAGLMKFLRKHAKEVAACDFFVVPTLFFKRLYVFIVIGLHRRKILHIAVTTNPTAEWTAEQLCIALTDQPQITYLQRDGDGIFGHAVSRALTRLGVKELVNMPASPWMNCFVERSILTLRLECVNHLIPISAAHLERELLDYAFFYNHWRCHSALDGDSPNGRPVYRHGRIVPVPLVGGLHTRYVRVA